MSCNKLPLKPASISAAAAARSNSQELARRSHADFWGVLDTAGVRGVPPKEGFLEKVSSSSKRPPLLPAIPSGTIPPFGLAERMASSPAYQMFWFASVRLFVGLFVCWLVGLFYFALFYGVGPAPKTNQTRCMDAGIYGLIISPSTAVTVVFGNFSGWIRKLVFGNFPVGFGNCSGWIRKLFPLYLETSVILATCLWKLSRWIRKLSRWIRKLSIGFGNFPIGFD